VNVCVHLKLRVFLCVWILWGFEWVTWFEWKGWIGPSENNKIMTDKTFDLRPKKRLTDWLSLDMTDMTDMTDIADILTQLIRNVFF